MDIRTNFLPGLRIGHAHDLDALTGCTVILCETGAVGGVDQRGGAPGTRQTDALTPLHLVDRVHAVVLTGGSAFGLDAASGVVHYLEERGVGFDVRIARVPIVPTAVLFDLGIGRSDVRPDASMGYQACLNAGEGFPAEGNVGAGAGATVGKILGVEHAMKSGLGCCRLELDSSIIVIAVCAVNAFGDIIDPKNGEIIAGARIAAQVQQSAGSEPVFANSLSVMKTMAGKSMMRFGRSEDDLPQATVIGVVATNAALTREGVNKVAQMAQDGLARSVRPAHTMVDGDTIFALSIGSESADVSIIGAFAAEAFSQAVLRAVKAAQPAGGLPSYSSLNYD
jgi:L-aminopeptidase/D-esterase-like protein